MEVVTMGEDKQKNVARRGGNKGKGKKKVARFKKESDGER